ncbi:MAG: TatD family hydrolase [bacterium]
MFVDTHAHLMYLGSTNEIDRVIQRAGEAGIGKIICPSVNLKTTKMMLELTRKYTQVYGCAGLYPGDGQKHQHWRDDLDKIEKMVKSNEKVVGIGEIGLDSHWNEKNETLETEMFKAQLEMAVRLDKPVVIHNRLSHELIRKIIEQMTVLPRGQFHCFSGNVDFLDWVLSRGFYVGFDGNVTYKSNRELRELVKLVPSNRLLLETDSPYLPPIGKRGERNEPCNVRITGQIMADLRGQSLQALGEQTTENAIRLFKI